MTIPDPPTRLGLIAERLSDIDDLCETAPERHAVAVAAQALLSPAWPAERIAREVLDISRRSYYGRLERAGRA